MKSLIKDLLALILLLSVSIGAGYLFYLDKNTEPQIVGGEIVGEVISLKNDSVWIPGDRTREFTLDKPGDVYLFQTIKVNEEEGSRVTISLNPEYYNVESDIILYPGARIKFTAEGFRTEGQVAIQTEDGGIEEVSGTYVATIEDNQIKIETIKMEPRSPINMNILTKAETAPVSFRWRELEELTGKVLEVSRRQEFDRILVSKPVADDAIEISLPLAPGFYYWRLTGESGGRSYIGPESSFTVYRYVPAVQRIPQQDGEYTFFNKLNLDMVWNEAYFYNGVDEYKADYYQIDISESGRFTEREPILLGQKTRFQLTRDIVPGEGDYFWRITPGFSFYKDFNDAAAFQRFVDEDLNEVAFRLIQETDLPPLALLYPPEGEEINSLQIQEGISFRWERDTELDQYRFEIASDRDFTNLVARNIVDFTSYLWTEDLNPGTYFWRVQGLIPGSGFRDSEVGSFTIREIQGGLALLYPDEGRVIELGESNTQVSFKWQSRIPDAEYRFFIYRRGEESPFYKENTFSDSAKASLRAPEEYSWQVAIMDDRGRLIQSSPLQHFQTVSPFRAPRMIYPSNGQRISLLGENSLEFSWEAAPGASEYTFALIRNGETEPVLTSETAATSYLLEDLRKLESGSYRIELQAFRDNPPDGFDRESPLASSGFVIDDLVFYSPAVLSAPANGFSADQLTIRSRGLSFRWSQTPRLPDYTVEIFRIEDNGGLFKSFRLTDQTLSLEDFEPGGYYWRVRSFDVNGREAPVSETFRFNIQAVPDLQRPVITSPRDGSSINMQNSDELILQWNPVPDADFYKVVFINLKSGETLINREMDGTRIIFTELEKLDVGTFTLDIQAFKRNENLAVETPQSSPVVRSTFSLYLQDAYEEPNVISPDTQYTR